MSFCTEDQANLFLRMIPGIEKTHRQLWHNIINILVVG